MTELNAVPDRDDTTGRRQPRDHAVLCGECLRRTTFAQSGICFVCKPLPLPARPDTDPDPETAA